MGDALVETTVDSSVANGAPVTYRCDTMMLIHTSPQAFLLLHHANSGGGALTQSFSPVSTLIRSCLSLSLSVGLSASLRVSLARIPRSLMPQVLHRCGWLLP